MIKMNTKAQLGNLVPYILVFVMVGILLAISFIVMGNFIDATYTANVTRNETLTYSGNHTLSNVPIVGILSLRNTTDYSDYTNYSVVNKTTIQIFATTATTNYSINYTYSINNSATTSLFSTTTALATISDNWLAVLVIIVVTTLILGMVLGAFGSFGRQQR